MRVEVRPGRGEGVGQRRRKRRAGLGRLKAGGHGTRGAHVEHVLHVRDAGRVQAERLVERNRPLPSQMQGIRCGSRCEPGGERAWGR